MTYDELHDLRNDPAVLKKVHVAIAAVAYDILAPEANGTVTRTDWAKLAIKNPGQYAPEIVHFVLIANAASTPVQIKTAPDTAYKANVVTAVSKIVGPAAA